MAVYDAMLICKDCAWMYVPSRHGLVDKATAAVNLIPATKCGFQC